MTKTIANKIMPNETCPKELEKINGGCSLYFYYLYNVYPTEIKDVNVDYLNHIKNFPDPILKYVALYFYYVYSVARNFFTNFSNNQNLACNILNRWLDQHKSFFTHSENCYNSKKRWDMHMEELWKWLEKKFDGNTCIRSNVFSNSTQIPEGLETLTCSRLEPDDYICYNPSEVNDDKIKEDCDKLQPFCELCYDYYKDPTPFAQKQLSCDTCPPLIDIIGFPVCATFFGTLFIVFFLYKFTSLGRMLSNRDRNKNRFQQQFSEEMEYEEYERYRNNNQRSDNRVSHLYYQPMGD